MYITTCFVLGLAVWHSNVYKAAAQLDETSNRTFACYGTANSLLSPSCPSGSLVAPYQVSAGAKTNATGCPREIVDPAQADVCCVFDSNDCHGEYLNVDSQSTSYIYHADCVGRENCVGFARQASNMDINYLSCSPSFTYPDQTNYMFMDFYCIPGTRVGTISSANIQSSTDMIYLRGQDYTTSGIAVTSASCSVESDDCDVIISVYALDLRLANDSTGACIQELSLSGTVLDCSDDNNFKINEIHQSSNNYMTVNLSSTATNDGYFWIGFNTSSSSSDILTLRCPAQSQQTVCTTTTTEPTTVTTDITTEKATDNSTDNTTEETTTEMTNTTMQSPLPTHEGRASSISWGVVIAVVVIILVVIVGVVVIVVYCIKKRKKKMAKDADKTSTENDSDSFPQDEAPVITNSNPPTTTRLNTPSQQKNGITTPLIESNLPPLNQTSIKMDVEDTESRLSTVVPLAKEREKDSLTNLRTMNPIGLEIDMPQASGSQLPFESTEKQKKKKKKKKKRKTINREENKPVDDELKEPQEVPPGDEAEAPLPDSSEVINEERKKKKRKKKRTEVSDENDNIDVTGDGQDNREKRKKKKKKKKLEKIDERTIDDFIKDHEENKPFHNQVTPV